MNAFQPDELYLKETRTNKDTGESQQTYAGGSPVAVSIAANLLNGMISAGEEPSTTKALNLAFKLIVDYNERFDEYKKLLAKAEADKIIEAEPHEA